jgi:hypothetical protein
MTTVRLRYVHSFVDRHGHARYYFRIRGQRWPLPAPGDPGFMAAYEACKARIAAGVIPFDARDVWPGHPRLGRRTLRFIR